MSCYRLLNVRRLASLLACVTWVGLAGGAVGQDVPVPAAPDSPAALVRQLGDDSYAARRRSAQQLAALGLKAREALLVGLKTSDPEVRRQCRGILADVFETDFQQRLKAFAADTQEESDHGLPGWRRYRRLIGSDWQARALFIHMQRSEGGLLEAAAAGGQAAADSLTLRLRQMFQAMNNPDPRHQRQPSPGTLAALLFVASDPDLDLPQGFTENPYLMAFIQQGDLHQALTEGPYKSGMRKLLGQWILRPASPDTAQNKLMLAMQFGIPEGRILALQMLRAKDPPAPHRRAFAVVALGKLGGKPYAAALHDLLDDRTEVSQGIINNKRSRTEIRDVALAWLIHLTGQDHAAYGQEMARADYVEVRRNPGFTGNIGVYGFSDPAKRDAALEKWKAYVAEHPLPALPSEASELPKPPPSKAAAKPLEQPQEDADEPEFRPQGVPLPPADREQARNLALARDLCALGQYATATQLLDGILAAESDCVFAPRSGAAVLQCLTCAASQLVGELPADGRRVYQLQFATIAQRSLAEAIKAGDMSAIARVAARFFYTPAGAEATYLLAAHDAERGHVLRAAIYLERVRDKSPYADRLEPALSLRLAACWSCAGMAQAADAVLRTLPARVPEGRVRIAGQPRELFARPEQARAWLESIVGPPRKSAPEGGWPMFRGNPPRNLPADVGSPFLQAPLLRSTSDDPAVRDAVEKLYKQRLADYREAMPRLHPLVVGKTILMRTATHLVAINAADESVLWDAALDDCLRHLLRPAHTEQETVRPRKAAVRVLARLLRDTDAERPEDRAEDLRRGLQGRVWGDLTFGTLSSDGHCVFGVEDLLFGQYPDYQRMVVTPEGKRRLDAGPLKNHNLLTAYDIRTGKLKWEIGGPPDAGAPEPAGAFFLGPPLPLGARLYAVADINNQTRLLELDAETGRLLSSLTLAVREQWSLPLPPDVMPLLLMSDLPHRSGATPSYADGIAVCHTGENQFVAVDLATRALCWVYQPTEPEPAASENGMGIMGVVQRRLLASLAADPGDRWADSSPTIAADRVLLSPPEGNELVCLSLADGRWHWSAPRGDGLYVAGALEGRVIVVGRGSVQALDLSDGKLRLRLPLPAGAVPSGRGFLSQDRCYVPLSTGEVAAFDLRQGRLVSRSRSPEGIVPGNLVACQGAIVSQNVEGLRLFPPLSARAARLSAALDQRPEDPELLGDQGEVLLSGGRISEAVAVLRRAQQIKPTPRTRQLLVEALCEGLRTDFDSFRALVDQVSPLVEQQDSRARLWREVALGWQRAGRNCEAFDAYLKLIDLNPHPEMLERFETARAVRHDRWAAARLAEVQRASQPVEAAQIERRMTAFLQERGPRQFLTYFGWHALAHQARLTLSDELAKKKQALEAEQLLWCVLRQGSAAQQRAATARLALLLRQSKEPEAAARFYRCLQSELAEVVCLDGKTGRQLVEALPADDPVRRCLASKPLWPAGKVRKVVSGKQPGINNMVWVRTMSEGGPLGAEGTVQYNPGPETLNGFDSLGRRKWQVALQGQFTGEGDEPVFGGEECGGSRGWSRGHWLVAWLGDRVCAVDGFGRSSRPLWSRRTVTVDPRLIEMGLAMPCNMPQAATALPGAEPLPLALGADCVCFRQEEKLLAVDPLSGEVLWMRDDCARLSDLFGDDELLLVTPPQSNEAAVLSVLDGRVLESRPVPPLKDRLSTVGRRVVTWQTGAEKARLALRDPCTGKTLWQREFDSKAQPWLVDGGEAAVLDPQGRLAVVALSSGSDVLRCQVDPLPALEGIAVLRSSSNYVLVANTAGRSNSHAEVQLAAGEMPVGGRVYGLDRGTGERLWSIDVADQGLRLDQPADLPVLTFVGSGQMMTGDDVHGYSRLLCLDRRSGRVLHTKSTSDNVPTFFEIRSDPQKGRVEIHTYLAAITFTFTEESANGAKPRLSQAFGHCIARWLGIEWRESTAP